MALIGLNGLELELGRTNNHLIDCRLSNLIATVGFEKMFTYYALYTYVLQKYYYGRLPQRKKKYLLSIMKKDTFISRVKNLAFVFIVYYSSTYIITTTTNILLLRTTK